jgi:site-specific recombinase XerD
VSNLPNYERTAADFVGDYERHLFEVRGLAPNSRKLHLRVVRYLFSACFPDGIIHWNDFHFSQVADFITSEFKRLPNHWTQKAWLVAVRGLLRYLETEEHIPRGWRTALPRKVNRKHAGLPRYLSADQMDSLWNVCREQTHRHIRDRA